MLIRLLDNLPGKRGCEFIAFKIEVMLSGVPSWAKAETERSRSIPREHRRRPDVRLAFHGILRLRAAPPPPSRRWLRMTSDFGKQPDTQVTFNVQLLTPNEDAVLTSSPRRGRKKRTGCSGFGKFTGLPGSDFRDRLEPGSGGVFFDALACVLARRGRQEPGNQIAR